MVKLVSRRPAPEMHANSGLYIPGDGEHFDFPAEWADKIVKAGLAVYAEPSTQDTQPIPEQPQPKKAPGK